MNVAFRIGLLAALVSAALSLGGPATALAQGELMGKPAAGGQKARHGRLERLAGSYRAEGRNANGTRYTGRVSISVDGAVAYFRWEIGKQVYRGRGTLNGDVLTVDWGQAEPVIYIVGRDGVLMGTWDKGRASERLSRR